MKRVAVVLVLALLLGGCVPGERLVDGFLPYYSHEGPHMWVGRTIVNALLFVTYATASVAYIAARVYIDSHGATCR